MTAVADRDDARRIGELIEASSLGTPEARRLREAGRGILAGTPGKPLPGSYGAGYRDGASSLIADIRVQFDDAADTMDDLLEFFRGLTGDPELDWPEGAGKSAGDG